jgi:hypothetical protein
MDFIFVRSQKVREKNLNPDSFLKSILDTIFHDDEIENSVQWEHVLVEVFVTHDFEVFFVQHIFEIFVQYDF